MNAANKGNLTPLMYAAEAGHIDVLNALLAAGADVNALSSLGTTAAYLAAKDGHLNAVKALVAANADISIKAARDGTTALTIAEQKGHREVVQYLRSLRRGRPFNW